MGGGEDEQGGRAAGLAGREKVDRGGEASEYVSEEAEEGEEGKSKEDCSETKDKAEILR